MKKHLIKSQTAVKFVFTCLFFVSGLLLFGQGAPVQGWAEAGTYLGNNSRLPFLLRANQFGTVPLRKPAFTARAGFFFDSQNVVIDSSSTSKRSKFHWAAGGEAVVNAGSLTNQLILPEAYVKIGWKKIEFWAGRRKEIIGIVDTTLSSGSFTWSGNALPMPKIQIGFPQYVSPGFLKNYVAIKGFIAHGWYNTPYIQGAYLHQKTLHIRLGKPSWKFTVQAGVDHHATWAGRAEYLKTSPHAINGQLTNSFNDFLWGVVIGKIPKVYRNNRFTNFDGENRVGNHVGQFDFAFEYKLPSATIMLYNNHPFEDASGLLFQNMPDGLYGLSWKSKKKSGSLAGIRGALFEYVFSKDQSGAGWNVEGSRFKGNDNYFNHQQYIEGWSYFGKGIGTPLIAPLSEIRPGLQQQREFFPSSRIAAYHLGLEGTAVHDIQWMTKATFSTNFGTNNSAIDPPARQFSGLLMADAPLLKKGNLRIMAKLAYDQGDFFVHSLAGYIGVRTSGSIRFR